MPEAAGAVGDLFAAPACGPPAGVVLAGGTGACPCSDPAPIWDCWWGCPDAVLTGWALLVPVHGPEGAVPAPLLAR